MGRYYIWFVVVVAGLAGAIRVLLPRRVAEQQLQLFKRTTTSRVRLRGVIFLVAGLLFGAMYFLPFGHQAPVVIAIGTIFSILSAIEVFFQAQFHSLEALVFQSRILGILYLGLAAASYMMLARV